jgi:hypothetical protein
MDDIPRFFQVRDLSGCPTLVGSCHCSAGHLSAVEAAVQLGGTRHLKILGEGLKLGASRSMFGDD